MPAILRNSFNTNAILGESFNVGVGPDVTAPTFAGGATLTATSKTSTTVALATSVPATDNIEVMGYEWSSDNGATYPFTSLASSFEFAALTDFTSYQFRVRAYDAAGNRSAHLALTTSTYRAGDTGQNILDNTGPIEGGYPGILFDRVEAGEQDDWFWAYVTEEPATGVLTLNANGTYEFTGPDATSATVQFGKNADAVGEPVPVLFYTQDLPVEPEPPVFEGAISVTGLTPTSYTLTWPAATGDVDGYEVSLNDGADYTDVGLVTTLDVTGRTPESTDMVRVRAYNDVPLISEFLSTSVTLLEIPVPPELSLASATPTGATTADASVTTDKSGGALFWLRTENLTEDNNAVVASGSTQPVVAAGVQNFGVTSIDPESTGRLHIVHRDADGNVSDTISTNEFTTSALGGGSGGNGRRMGGMGMSMGL